MRPVDSRANTLLGRRQSHALHQQRGGPEARHGLRAPAPSSSILLAGRVNRVGSELEL
jgi:hypothetical protein